MPYIPQEINVEIEYVATAVRVIEGMINAVGNGATMDNEGGNIRIMNYDTLLFSDQWLEKFLRWLSHYQ